MSLDRNRGCAISAESAQGGLTNTDESDGSIASLRTATPHHGNPDLVGQPLTALFCSNRCPGDLILKTYDLARALRDASAPVIGGFQTPMEKECLRLLLRGDQPIVICPARGINNMRIPRAWRPALDDGRLLILSPFPASIKRPTAALAARRNEFVSTLAQSLLAKRCDDARLGAGSVLALDNDGVAVSAARQNLEYNPNVSGVRVADGSLGGFEGR